MHVGKEGASNLSALRKHSVEDELPFASYCILHEFFAPYNAEFEQLLAEYGFPPMRSGRRARATGCRARRATATGARSRAPTWRST